jgi:hypothetical protein
MVNMVRMTSWLRIWKVEAMIYFKLLLWNLIGDTVEKREDTSVRMAGNPLEI